MAPRILLVIAVVLGAAMGAGAGQYHRLLRGGSSAEPAASVIGDDGGVPSGICVMGGTIPCLLE